MDKPLPSGERPTPHFVTTSNGQLRIWTDGTGPALVVLPGLMKGPQWRLRECAAAFPGYAVVVVELPGLGGSSAVDPATPLDLVDRVAGRLAEWMNELGQGVVLLAFDRTAALAELLVDRCPNIRRAAKVTMAEPYHQPMAPLDLQWDGTHLIRMWSHLRDLDMLSPANRAKVRVDAVPYMTAEDLDEAMLCFAQRPVSYSELWNGLGDRVGRPSTLPGCVTVSEAETLLRDALIGEPDFTMTSSPPPALGIARQYVDVSRGRVHLRRAGSGRRLLLAFLAGAGSSSNLEPLLKGLSDRYTVVAPDYIGQGDGCRDEAPTDVAQLAADAAEVASALGFDHYSVYGTHTGAGVAIELAIARPEEVEAVILDGISMTPPSERVEHRALYFPTITPDLWGLYLLQTWNIRRDGGYFWPWFRPDRDHARKGEAPDLPLLHDRVISTLRSRSTPAYQAITAYDAALRLPLLQRPTLYVAGPHDTFAAHIDHARAVASTQVRFERTAATVWMTDASATDIAATLQVYDNFLNEPTSSHSSQ